MYILGASTVYVQKLLFSRPHTLALLSSHSCIFLHTRCHFMDLRLRRLVLCWFDFIPFNLDTRQTLHRLHAFRKRRLLFFLSLPILLFFSSYHSSACM